MTGPAVRVQAVPSEFEIGAWGHRFFESDHDYSIADELTKDSGFSDYSDSDEKRQWFERPKIPAKVHEYMSEGGLTKVFTVYRNMLSNYTLLDLKCPQLHGALLDSPRYYLLCLGLLAIEHGWSLDDEFIVWLKANYASMYLNKERELQAKMILGEFRNGMPCRLGDVGLNDMEMEVLMMSKGMLPSILLSKKITKIDTEQKIFARGVQFGQTARFLEFLSSTPHVFDPRLGCATITGPPFSSEGRQTLLWTLSALPRTDIETAGPPLESVLLAILSSPLHTRQMARFPLILGGRA
jgi:hypothetical protein